VAAAASVPFSATSMNALLDDIRDEQVVRAIHAEKSAVPGMKADVMPKV